MKNKIVLFLLIILFASCNKQEKTKRERTKKEYCQKKIVKPIVVEPKKVRDSIDCLPVLIDDPKLEKEKIELFGWIDYSKNKLDKVEKLFFSDFNQNIVEDPKYLYIENCSKSYINQHGVKVTLDFNGPLGMDEYYVLYAYFLQKKNGEAKYKKEREKLMELYNLIIDVYQSKAVSTTYTFNLSRRMIGCVEYSLQNLENYEKGYKDYAFKKEKELYINSLQEYILNEQIYISEEEFPWFDKKEAKISAEKNIKSLEKSITNYYYLEQLRLFEMQYFRLFGNYEYRGEFK